MKITPDSGLILLPNAFFSLQKRGNLSINVKGGVGTMPIIKPLGSLTLDCISLGPATRSSNKGPWVLKIAFRLPQPDICGLHFVPREPSSIFNI